MIGLFDFMILILNYDFMSLPVSLKPEPEAAFRVAQMNNPEAPEEIFE